MTTPQKLFYNNQICWIVETIRRPYGPGRAYNSRLSSKKGPFKYGNRYIVRFEDGHVENIPAGKFNSEVKFPPVELTF